MLAVSTEAWLLNLIESIHEVEGDSEDAFRARRQLVRLLLNGIVIKDKRKGVEPRGRITYRYTSEPDGAGREQGSELYKVPRNSDKSRSTGMKPLRRG